MTMWQCSRKRKQMQRMMGEWAGQLVAEGWHEQKRLDTVERRVGAVQVE